eukprot:scpid111256/ scgid35255/ 
MDNLVTCHFKAGENTTIYSEHTTSVLLHNARYLSSSLHAVGDHSCPPRSRCYYGRIITAEHLNNSQPCTTVHVAVCLQCWQCKIMLWRKLSRHHQVLFVSSLPVYAGCLRLSST